MPQAAKPGVTYDVSVIARKKDSKPAPQGTPTKILSAVVLSTQDIAHDGRTLSLQIRKTEYGRATFQVTFPDKKVQQVKVKAGETKDVLPEGEDIGLRIAVQECH